MRKGTFWKKAALAGAAVLIVVLWLGWAGWLASQAMAGDGSQPAGSVQLTGLALQGEAQGPRAVAMGTHHTQAQEPPAATQLTGQETLFHILDGGRFFHLLPACPSVSQKRLPLASFPASSLEQLPYADLMPCTFCAQ